MAFLYCNGFAAGRFAAPSLAALGFGALSVVDDVGMPQQAASLLVVDDVGMPQQAASLLVADVRMLQQAAALVADVGML